MSQQACRHGAGCRMMVPTHPNYSHHTQFFWHPPPDATIAAAIATATYGKAAPVQQHFDDGPYHYQHMAAAATTATTAPAPVHHPQPVPYDPYVINNNAHNAYTLPPSPAAPQPNYMHGNGMHGYNTVAPSVTYNTNPTGFAHQPSTHAPSQPQPVHDPYTAFGMNGGTTPPVSSMPPLGTRGRIRCQSGESCPMRYDGMHESTYCHAQTCPYAPCPLSAEVNHQAKFYHPATSTPAPAPTPAPAHVHAPVTNGHGHGHAHGSNGHAATPTPSRKPCPSMDRCQLSAYDPAHEATYWHICPNSAATCSQFNNPNHIDAYKHLCPQEDGTRGCRTSDPEHTRIYHHRRAPSPIPGSHGTVTSGIGGHAMGTAGGTIKMGGGGHGVAATQLPPLPDCRHGVSCRMIDPAHPHHAVHITRFSHLVASDFKDIQIDTLKPCPNNDVVGGCSIFLADPRDVHCFDFSHHCPDGSTCSQQSVRTHYSRFLHPCTHGLTCKEFLDGDRAHCAYYSHTTERLPYCATPQVADCKQASDPGHTKKCRHICPTPAGERCEKYADPEHAARFVHPCRDGDKCNFLKAPATTGATARAGTLGASKLRELHLSTYSHTCMIQDCKNTDSPHCYDFHHATTFIPKSLKYPEHWDEKAQTRAIQYFPVTQASAEWKMVETEFKRTMPVASIKSIERYQHPQAWMQYCERKEYIGKKNGVPPEEKMLFHGTKNNILNYVLGGRGVPYQGFDYRMSRMGSVGCGIYTARDALYSDNGYVDAPDTQGLLHMLLCNVITGISCAGKAGLIEPPDQPPPAPPGTPYDSVTNGQPPIMWIVHDGRRIYPLYIIHYTRA